jgi:hypothetical protein
MKCGKIFTISTVRNWHATVTPIRAETVFRLNFATVRLFLQLLSQTADYRKFPGPSSASLGSTFRSRVSTFRIHIHLSLDITTYAVKNILSRKLRTRHDTLQTESEVNLLTLRYRQASWLWQMPSRKYCISRIRRPLQLLLFWTSCIVSFPYLKQKFNNRVSWLK